MKLIKLNRGMTVVAVMALAFSSFLRLPARTTAAAAFTAAPMSVFSMVDSLTRLDMVDYFMAGRDTPSKNVAGRDSRLTALGLDSLVLELSDKVTQALYLLPAGGDTLYAVVKTYALPALDSSVKFYDSSWHPIDPAKVISMPDRDKWMVKPDKATRRLLEENVPFIPARVTVDPVGGTLTVTNTLVNLLPREAMAAVAPVVKAAIVYTWDPGKRKFKPVK